MKCPDWDLVSNILIELERWPNLILQHVRGHQDRKVAYSRLPLLAQLNVDADTMATMYQCEHGMSRPLALLTATAGVHVITPAGTMTSNYEAVIRYQATYPDLYKYIQERNGWSPRIMANINWKAHGSGLRKQLKRKTHYLKLVHGILPTCKHLHRQDQIRSRCPFCKSVSEDWAHILRCSHPTREQWRTEVITNMTKTCSTIHTRPYLTRVLCEALDGWLHHTTEDIYQLNPEVYPPAVHRLIRQQNEIGWHQLFLGRFSTEWSDLQDNYYARLREEKATKGKKQTGQRWQVLSTSD